MTTPFPGNASHDEIMSAWEREKARPLFVSTEFSVASMLSDVQELIERDRNDDARRLLNAAKAILFAQDRENRS